MARFLEGLLLLLLAVTTLLVDSKSYNGHRLMRVVPTTQIQVAKLKFMEEELEVLDFWTEPELNRNVDINIPPNLLTYVTMNLATVGLQGEIIHTDLQKLIDQNRPKNSNSYGTMRAKALVEKGLTQPHMALFVTGEEKAPEFIRVKLKGIAKSLNKNIVGTFPRYDDLMTWMLDQALIHPDLATVEYVGVSYEGRPQRLIKIGAHLGYTKPIVWVDSGFYGREWLPVSTTVWIIKKMLATYHTDPKVRYLMDQYDWYFLPVANPDGFEYSHTTDRLWRKTRTPSYSNQCNGADPNKNWDYKWMESGTSSNPCSGMYGGSHAFSEPCIQNMRGAILEVKDRIRMYMGLYSYDQKWHTPWSADSSKPSDYSDLLAVANAGNRALQAVHGTVFQVGTPSEIHGR